MIFQYTQSIIKPGPASTVEERSLRKIFVKGTVVRYSPRMFFSDREKHLCLTEHSTIGQVTISQPRSEKAVEIRSTV